MATHEEKRRTIGRKLSEILEELEDLERDLQLDPLTEQPDETILSLAKVTIASAVTQLQWVDSKAIRAQVERDLDAKRGYVEIEAQHVGKALFEAFGRKWPVSGFIGKIMRNDIGKRVYLTGDILQVENDEQRAKRKASEVQS